MLGASTAATTASRSTSHIAEIFLLTDSGIFRSDLITIASGVIPIERNAATLCCVGFVFNSPEGPMYGTSDTCK